MALALSQYASDISGYLVYIYNCRDNKSFFGVCPGISYTQQMGGILGNLPHYKHQCIAKSFQLNSNQFQLGYG